MFSRVCFCTDRSLCWKLSSKLTCRDCSFILTGQRWEVSIDQELLEPGPYLNLCHNKPHFKTQIKFAVGISRAELNGLWFYCFLFSKAIISCPWCLYRDEVTHLHKSFHRCAGQTSCGTNTWGRGPSPRRCAGNPRYRSYMSLSKSTGH